MATSDDFSDLWLPEPSSNPATQPFRQGTIVTFDQTSGANTVLLAGATLTNLPLLNIGDTVNLKPGDPVLLGKMNNAMFIMGRVIPVGNAQLTGNIVQTVVAEGIGSNFTTTTGQLAYSISSPNFVTPVWCNHIDVICIATASVDSTAATKTFMHVAAQAGASIGPEAHTNLPAGDYGSVTVSHTATASGPGLGGFTFNCATLIRTSVAYTAIPDNLAQTTAIAIFTRV